MLRPFCSGGPSVILPLRPVTAKAHVGAFAHRFVWDLRHAPPPATEHGYPISAIWGDTPLEPRGVWVMPGTYRLQLTVAGKTFEQQLVVRMVRG